MKVRIISGVVGGILAILILILHKTFVFPLAIAALICTAVLTVLRKHFCDNRIDIPLYRCDVCRNGFAA